MTSVMQQTQCVRVCVYVCVRHKRPGLGGAIATIRHGCHKSTIRHGCHKGTIEPHVWRRSTYSCSGGGVAILFHPIPHHTAPHRTVPWPRHRTPYYTTHITHTTHTTTRHRTAPYRHTNLHHTTPPHPRHDYGKHTTCTQDTHLCHVSTARLGTLLLPHHTLTKHVLHSGDRH
jgi:hypothetical protein